MANADIEFENTYRNIARKEFNNGDDINVDEGAPVLMVDDGAWVQAWVFVSAGNDYLDEGD